MEAVYHRLVAVGLAIFLFIVLSASEVYTVSTYTRRIDLGHVDVSKLQTDEDIRREAHRLLPEALVQIGEAAGETAWQELQRGLGSIRGFKVNSSSSDKRSFIREAGRNYRRQASEQDKRKLEDQIVQQLRERKKSNR